MAIASLSPINETSAFVPRLTLAPDEYALYTSSKKLDEVNQTILPSFLFYTKTAKMKGPSISPSSFS